jgi:hypothetical protein
MRANSISHVLFELFQLHMYWARDQISVWEMQRFLTPPPSPAPWSIFRLQSVQVLHFIQIDRQTMRHKFCIRVGVDYKVWLQLRFWLQVTENSRRLQLWLRLFDNFFPDYNYDFNYTPMIFLIMIMIICPLTDRIRLWFWLQVSDYDYKNKNIKKINTYFIPETPVNI